MTKREVILAETAGFCFGVNRAVKILNEQIEVSCEKGDRVYTLGPIIHNEEVVKAMEEKGVITCDDLNSYKNMQKGRVIIRSHGIGEAVYKELEEMNFSIVDATCPFVKKIHNIVSSVDDGTSIVIVGNENHPEVKGIIGWCSNRPVIVDSVENAEKKLESLEKNIVLVSQTTFNSNKFKELVEFFRKKEYNVIVYNTICNATRERQLEAKQLAASVDVMIVIGGKHSSNTQKLYEICKKECQNTYYIQTLVDLDLTAIESAKRVGITAGASTPNNIIKEVHDACQN